MNPILLTCVNIIVYNILSIPLVFQFLKSRHLIIEENPPSIWLWFTILLFSIFPLYSGDWIHYKEIVYWIANGYYSKDHIEPIYIDLVEYIGNQYLLFRCIIWGSAIILLRATFIHLEIHNKFTLQLFIIWALLFYAYPRVSLALSLFFWGYSLMVKPYERKILSYSIGIITIILSYYFHKSMIIILFLSPFSLINLGRWKTFLLCLFSYFIILLSKTFLFNSFLMEDNHVEGYLNSSARVTTWSENLKNFLIRTPLYLTLIYMIVNISLKNKLHEFDKWEKCFYNFTIYISGLAFLFLIIGIERQAVFYRTLYMSFIPLCIFLSRYFQKYNNKWFKTTTILAYMGGNAWLFYCLVSHINGAIK